MSITVDGNDVSTDVLWVAGDNSVIDNLYDTALNYEEAIEAIREAGSGGTISIAELTARTSEVQIKQAIMELMQGVTKSLSTVINKLGQKLGG